MSVDRTALPRAIQDVIDTLVESAGLQDAESQDERGTGGMEEAGRLRRDLVDHFEEGLAAGRAPDELIASFGDPRAAGRRIAMVRDDGLAAETPPEREGVAGFSAPRTMEGRAAVVWSEACASFRNLLRAPGFSALVLLTLALGVGANTAIFSVLDAVLIKPLPYQQPRELITVQETWQDHPPSSPYTRALAVREMRDWDAIFSDVATIYTYRETGTDLVGPDGSRRLITSYVSAGYFETLGAEPILGRVFVEDESFGPGERGDDTQVPRVAVLSYALWNQHFGADQAIVGKSVELSGNLTEIIGVMPARFRNPMGSKADVWIPQDLRPGDGNSWHNYYLTTIARLTPGVSIDQATTISRALVDGVRERVPESGEWGVALTALQNDIVGTARRTMLLIMAAAAGLVLLSACVNVGNLVFARGIDREREIALRGALGSARGRQLLHLVLENGWLALGGSLLGLVLGLGGVKVLLAAAPDALPNTVGLPGLSMGVLAFAIAAMVASLAVFGLAPALSLSQVALAKALNGSGRSGTSSKGLRRLRSAFVVAQVTVALVLMIGAGLLMRSFEKIQQASLGVLPEQALTFEVHLPSLRYGEGLDRIAFHDQFEERLAGLPGVSAAGAVSWLPLNGRYNTWGSMQEVGPEVGPGEDPELGVRSESTDVRVMAGDYFAAAGIHLLQGRLPTKEDSDSEGLIWISKIAGDQAFPDKNPIGRQVSFAGQQRRVTGVVADVAIDARGTMVPTAYLPHRQFADDRNWPLTQIVRARGDVDLLRGAAEHELHSIDPGLVLFRPQLFEGFVDTARAQDRFSLLLMSVFAVLGMTLVTVGTYSVLAGNVARRQREFGIRMALGADGASVRWTVLKGSIAMMAAGIAVGGSIAFVGSRWLSSMLFEIEATDSTTYLGAAAALLAIGLVASLVPALRATQVDPARTLSDS